MRLSLELRQSQSLELRQELECTMQLSQRLEDPFEFARQLFGDSRKVNVPLKIGRYTIMVRAAIVDENSLGMIFEDEKFAGLVARFGEQYQFFNRNLKVPEEFARRIPQLMAFHCLAAIKVPDFGDSTGELSQYQAIALEMAYARTQMGDRGYGAYEAWRPLVERSAFFQRGDWQEIVAKTYQRFRHFVEPMHLNAHHACFPVMAHGEVFMLGDGKATSRRGQELPVFRKTVYRR